MSSSRSRRLLAGVWAMTPLPLLFLVSLLVPVPAVLPTQWGGGGVDTLTSGSSVLGTVLLVTTLCTAGVALLVGLRAVLPPTGVRWALALLGGIGAGAVGALLTAVVGTRLAGGDPAAVGVGWPLLVLPLALGWAWVGYALHGEQHPPLAEVVDAVPERDRVLAGAAAPWGPQDRVDLPWTAVSSCDSMRWVALAVAVITAAVGVLLRATGEPWWLVLALVALGAATVLVVQACRRVEVVVDARGLILRSRTLPLRLVRVRARDVVGAGVADLDPLEWGGWGLRWSPGRTVYIGSGGPGLVVHQRTGRRFAVELPGGEQVAATGARALRQVALGALAGTSD